MFDDPAARMRFATDSYLKLDRPARFKPYARAVLDFMRWQDARGVLNPPYAAKPGSPWWRAVNEDLLRDTEDASIVVRQGGRADRPSVERWVRFFETPSPASWYLAHNGSVVEGYLNHQDLAATENPAERFFMDVVLLRVLYAQALVSDGDLALGRLSFFARLIGHPKLRSPGVFLAMTNVLPDDYPIAESIDQLIDRENPLGRLLDYGVIAGRVDELYASAARLLDQPRLRELRPLWTPRSEVPRTSLLESLVKWLTRPRRWIATEML